MFKNSVKRGTDTHTHTDGHRNSRTESDQRADSVKSDFSNFMGKLHTCAL